MSSRLEPGVFLGRSLSSATLAGVTLTDIRYTSGAARHHHARAYFSLIRRGTYEETFGRRMRVCRPGLLVFHPPGESHAQRLRTRSVRALNVELGPDWLARMHELGAPIDQPMETADPEVVSLAARLLPSIASRGTLQVLQVESLIADVLGRLGGTCAPPTRHGPAWLRDVRDLVDANPAQPPRLAALAALAGVHPVYLAQAFRRSFGCSLGEYARRRRLDEARERLAEGLAPLAEIALDTGFADQSHFTRAFKRFTGVTPRQYRTFLAFKTR